MQRGAGRLTATSGVAILSDLRQFPPQPDHLGLTSPSTTERDLHQSAELPRTQGVRRAGLDATRFMSVFRVFGRSVRACPPAGRGDFPPIAAERSMAEFVGLDVGERGASLNLLHGVDEVSHVQLS